MAAINAQWERGHPSNDVSGAGLLVHVLDGLGIHERGFTGTSGGLPPPGGSLWDLVGKPDASVGYGDRVSCSIISKRMPDMFEPEYVDVLVESGFRRLPFVLLDTNVTAVRDRISCCYAKDGGSIIAMCSPPGGGDTGCTPGCQHDSFPPVKLQACLNGYLENRENCRLHPSWCSATYYNAYNEVILDKWREGGWDKNTYVLAVGIPSDASEAVVRLGRDVYSAALASGADVPFLRYDSAATRNPFSLVDVPQPLALQHSSPSTGQGVQGGPRVVDRLNARFHNAQSSNDLGEIGVLVHTFDGQEDPTEPWLACRPEQSCAFYGDRVSTSLVRPGRVATYEFQGAGAGVIANPGVARLLCAYGGDGATRGKTCNPPGVSAACTPGCTMRGGWGLPWCDADASQDSWCNRRPWRPSDLHRLITIEPTGDGGRHNQLSSYDELVLDGSSWNAHMPNAIEAFVKTSADDRHATELHAAFLARYGLSAAQVPLVLLSTHDLDRPFVEVSASGGLANAATAPVDYGTKVAATGDISELGYG